MAHPGESVARDERALRRTRVVVAAALPVLTAVLGLAIALLVTPAVPVTVFGQELRLGAVSPIAIRAWSGPGQADLFGEGSVETALQFDGPIRPRIEWQRFARDPAASTFVETSAESGPTLRTGQLGDELAHGWTSYVVRLVVGAAVISLGLCLAVLGIRDVVRRTPHHQHSRRTALLQIAAAVGLGALVTGGSVALTVASVRGQLTSVATLSDITGTAPLVPNPAPVGPIRADVSLAVIGDSTAAGVGNEPVEAPSAYDETCGRSQDAYAEVLGSALGASVANLACSSATIDAGVLGRQVEGDVAIPPQVGVLKSLPALRAVVVSVGANDIGWSDFLRLCYGLQRCDDLVSERLFQNRLDVFRVRYAQLLQQLSSLPTHPTVVVTGYYDPFGDTFECEALQDPQRPREPPPGYGFAADPGLDNQDQKVRDKIGPIRSELAQVNEVLRQGAEAFGFLSVTPSFAGHALCSAQPWVQGLSDRYPFHPRAAGELAIAAAVLPHLAADLQVP